MTIYQPGQSITITADTTLYALWRGIPSADMVWKIWSGTEAERFTYEDMNRITSNILTLEGLFSQSFTVNSFETVDRASMFSYSEAQKIEDAITELAEAMGMIADMETNWVALRGISYIDFERWESEGFAIYQAMGGTATRVAA